jgi:hypothetical protein
MRSFYLFALLAAAGLLAAWQSDPLEQGFLHPPAAAKPHMYYMLLNGYVDRAHMENEVAEYAKAGIGGLCLFDVGARGDAAAMPPAGPTFLGPASVADLAHIIRTAGRHGLEVDLSVTSSWDMGANWVKPEDAGMTLVQSSLELQGGKTIDITLPAPPMPPEFPPNGFARDTAILAIPNPQRVPGYQFDFELRPPTPHKIDRIVLYNNAVPEKGGVPHYSKDFVVSVSDTQPNAASFRPIVRAALAPQGGPQEFRFPATAAKYVRLHILNGHEPNASRLELAEFEVYSTAGESVNLNYRMSRLRDSAGLLRYTSAINQFGPWAAENIHDARREGPNGSWASGDAAALLIPDTQSVVDLTSRVDSQGRLHWDAPAGPWLILRYMCVNTGEKLKVPSPNSDGLATDHFNADATRRYIREVVARLAPQVGDLHNSPLKDLYLASYEVRGQVWTPAFLAEFRQRRGYDFTPYLPILNGGQVRDEATTERVMFDFQKTQGELLVDAYYRAAVETAHQAGLTIESEAGGPGPPLHKVPVDSLLAHGTVDSLRGEFWPDRMEHSGIWVIKEAASAAHIYGKKLVNMESFTTSNHWQEGPVDLKPAADRAFAEGMNHVVWHTSAHQPPLAGKPGWVYYAGTHLNQNVPWWPMAHAFLSYLARTSFLLQQGQPVADVLYYYGDQGYNFVPPKHLDPKLGYGHDYDVTNADALLRRLQVRNGKLTFPDGVQYEALILPERDDIDLAVLQRLEQLTRDGATIIGRKPQRASGYSGFPQRDQAVSALAAQLWSNCDGSTRKQVAYGKGLVACGLTPAEVLSTRNLGPDFHYTSPTSTTALDFVHRRDNQTEIYFIHNKLPRWETVQAEFRVRGKQPELWDADTAQHHDQKYFEATPNGTRFQLRLPPEGAIFVVFRRSAQPNPAAAPASTPPAPLNLAGPWKLRFTEGPAAPSPQLLTALRSWTTSPDAKERYFSGQAEYETDFTIPNTFRRQGHRAILELGDLWAVGEVTLNGRNLGVVWKRPFQIDATTALRPGANHLTVKVANNWVNRLIGDGLVPAAQRVTKTNVQTTGANTPIPWRDLPLHPSGLLGPVRLLSEPVQ